MDNRNQGRMNAAQSLYQNADTFIRELLQSYMDQRKDNHEINGEVYKRIEAAIDVMINEECSMEDFVLYEIRGDVFWFTHKHSFRSDNFALIFRDGSLSPNIGFYNKHFWLCKADTIRDALIQSVSLNKSKHQDLNKTLPI
ncbi:hypothetical protein [Bacillus pumilus]|uniref:hypothetical protein n=1 Tax=Bacillus pumilus TaxID=1408 RepID=UPI0011A72410|nr:hypothetical protein [Bacillus pumilus]